MEEMKGFTAYLRRLLQDLKDIEDKLKSEDTDAALKLIEKLKDDTQKDIET